MSTKVYCPCCGRFIGDYNSADESIVKATMVKPKNNKRKSCYLTNICKKCKSEIYILMEFKEVQVRRMSLVNEH